MIKSIERALFTMKLVKIRLCNKINGDFLAGNLVIYIEKDIAMNFTTYMIMDEFYSIKDYR
jgi:hypothetical protein